MKLVQDISNSSKYTIINFIQFDFEIKCKAYILTIRFDSGSKNNKNIAEFHFSAYLITTYHNQQGLLDDAVDSNIWIIQFSFLFSFLDDSFDQKRMLAQMYVHALKLVSHSQLVPLCHIMLEFISSLNHFTACDTIINLNSI